MSRLFRPANPPLINPSSGKRMLRRPDLRDLWTPRPSGEPLGAEIDFDEVIVHRSWRSFEPDRPGEVRYMMFEFSQKNPGSDVWVSAVKAVRFVRLTRVPRYLRSASGGAGTPGMVYSQQRDLMAALRQEQVLFVNMIAKSPDIPLIFAYGVQAVGASAHEAQTKADEAYAILCGQLDGTYQQLQYAPITLGEAEHLVRYQNEWGHVAAARGRPLPQGGSLGAGALLDGNRSDLESNAANQLEAFIRGMGTKSFMMTLITVPLSPGEISTAWANIAKDLSQARSETVGSRTISAGVALPLGLGSSVAGSTSDSHSTGAAVGEGTTDTVSRSVADGISASESVGHTSSVADSVTAGRSTAETVSASESLSRTQSLSSNLAESMSVTDTVGSSVGQSVSETTGVSVGQSEANSVSVGSTRGVTDSVAAGSNWSTAQGVNSSATTGNSQGISSSLADQLTQSFSNTNTTGDSSAAGATRTDTSGVSGGLGVSGSNSTASGTSLTNTTSSSNALGSSLTSGTTATTGVNSGVSNSLTTGASSTATAGGSSTTAQAVSASSTVTSGQTTGVALTQSAATAIGATSTQSVAQGVSSGVTSATGLSDATSVGQGVSRGSTVGASETVGRTVGSADSTSSSIAASRTVTDGTSSALSQNRALNDAFMVAQSRTLGSSGSLGVVPNVGIAVSRQTLNASKQILGDILDAQMRRYLEGMESGGFLYQLFLTAPDRETVLAGAGLLKSAFWGAGTPETRLAQPFHVVSDLADDEAARLRDHAALFTSYRKREPRTELIEPFLYSSYVTAGELASLCYPPTAEALGLMAQADSMPVLSMPADRAERDLPLGRVVDGERARVSDQVFGVDLDELTHILVAGVSGSGKTSTLMKLLYEAARMRRRVVIPPPPGAYVPTEKVVPTGILALDWMRNMRNLAQSVEPDRFRFYSIAKPALGAFVWNPLAVPDDGMDPGDWLAVQADNFTASWSLGEFGRSLIAELVDDLYRANRLEDTVLRPESRDADGVVVAEAFVLPAVDPAMLPPGAIVTGPDGRPVANVYTCPPLSRLVGVEHLAVLVAARIESLADPRQSQVLGRAFADRLQSLWRRVQYFAPGSKLSTVLSCDPDLATRRCLNVRDLIDPDRGLVTVVETDGLDQANRRLILGSVMLATYRFGLHHGEGCFNHGGSGPGTIVVLEEAHELFGARQEGDDRMSVETRTALWESVFRRARALGLRLVAVTQNPGDGVPTAVASNTTTAFIHRLYDDEDRKRAFSLLNWNNQIGQQQREWRYLGEMPVGYCIARLDARDDYLQSQPVQFKTDLAPLRSLSDDELAVWLRR